MNSPALYSAHHNLADKFLLNDSYTPLIALWRLIINDPDKCSREYERLWTLQRDAPHDFYLRIRGEFNADSDPIKLLFLMVRCAKNAVRFNSEGHFNQSSDKRRLGRNSQTMRKHLFASSFLLRKKAEFMNYDYETVLKMATPRDLIYMDPPYQGTSEGRNPRYHQGLDLTRFITNLADLKSRGIPFIVSFDGSLGDKSYGQDLPEYLDLKRVFINAGRSAQATLNGREDITVESLYISTPKCVGINSCPALTAA